MSEYLHGYNSDSFKDIRESIIYSVFPFREIKFLVISFVFIALLGFLNSLFPETRYVLYHNLLFKVCNQILQTVLLYKLLKCIFVKDRIEYTLSLPWNKGFAGYFDSDNKIPEYCHICNKKTKNIMNFKAFRRVHESSAKVGEHVKRGVPEYKPFEVNLHVCEEHEKEIVWKQIFSITGKILGKNLFYFREATGNVLDKSTIDLYKEIGLIEKIFGSLNNFEDEIRKSFDFIKNLQLKLARNVMFFSSIILLYKLMLIPQTMYNYRFFNVFAFSVLPVYFIVELLLLAFFIYLAFNNKLEITEAGIRSKIENHLKSLNFTDDKLKIMLKYLLPETPSYDKVFYKKP